MLMVNALAGCGKTTTAVFGLGGRVPKGMTLSEEQKEIIKVMRSYKWETAAAMAFNKSIAEELKTRVPSGVVAATSNSFGFTAWRNKMGGKVKVDGNKSNHIFRELAKKDGLKYQEYGLLEPDVVRMLSLLKGHLSDGSELDILSLADEFNIELTPQLIKYIDLSFQESLRQSGIVDFDDQIFMPLKFNAPIQKYDLVLVDECQDLNKAKQELAMRMTGKWLVAIGDSNQAIYGFSGADSNSMTNLKERMRERGSVTELGLTMTRRCPKNVVNVANRYVPSLRAAEDAPEGQVEYIAESSFFKELVDAKDGRMILCRSNAPLASLAFRLIADKRRCFIQGKDIGAGLVKTVEKSKGESFQEKVENCCVKLEEEILKLSKDITKQAKVEAKEDRLSCIKILAKDCETIEQFREVTEQLFKNYGDPGDHWLSSVHKSKGLEHKRVYIYKPSKLPLIINGKKKQSAKQIQQEFNLAYVAYTRSQNILTFVKEEEKEKDE